MTQKKKAQAKAIEAEQQPPYSLRSVYLRGSRTSFADDFDPLIPGIPLAAVHRIASQTCVVRATEFGPEGATPTRVRSATFFTTFEFRYFQGDKNPAPEPAKFLVEVSAEFGADYLLNRTVDPTADELNAWGASNVLLHTWPYWREFCHATLMRMGVPPVVMPMMVAGPAPAGLEHAVVAIGELTK